MLAYFACVIGCGVLFFGGMVGGMWIANERAIKLLRIAYRKTEGSTQHGTRTAILYTRHFLGDPEVQEYKGLPGVYRDIGGSSAL